MEPILRRRMASLALLVLLALAAATVRIPAADDLVVVVSAEYGHQTSASAQAIEAGLRLALEEANAEGGALGRRFRLEGHDHRSVPARALAGFKDAAARPEVVAVVHGKFSPAALEVVPAAHDLGMPLLMPWSAADGLIDHGRSPSWTFRLSLRDAWAMGTLVDRAALSGHTRLGLLVPANAWGRSSASAAVRHLAVRGAETLVATEWYPFGADTMAPQLRALREAGAQALILVANEGEGALAVREMAARPAELGLPIFAHWGITGGDFVGLCGPALARVRLEVVQTILFATARGATAARVAAGLERITGVPVERLPAAVGAAHAYDLGRLLVQAVRSAGTADRPRIRAALEELPAQDGLVARYAPPFTADRHEALSPAVLTMARFDGTGRLVPVEP